MNNNLDKILKELEVELQAKAITDELEKQMQIKVKQMAEKIIKKFDK